MTRDAVIVYLREHKMYNWERFILIDWLYDQGFVIESRLVAEDEENRQKT